MHPMLQARVFSAPDGARPNINRFPFSQKESNSFTVVLPINALVHGNTQPRVAPVRYHGFFSIPSAIHGCGPEQFRPMECGFPQAFSKDCLLNLPLQVLQCQPLCKVKRNEGR